MKSKRRVSDDEDSSIGIKRFLCSDDSQDGPDDGKPKTSSSSSEVGLTGGLVIKSFYGNSSKCAYLNPLERKTNREKTELLSFKSIHQLQETPKEGAVVKYTEQPHLSQRKLKSKLIKKSTARKLEITKCRKQKSTEPLVNTKCSNSSEGKADSHNRFSDTSVPASTKSAPNKFFRNRSPRKHALLLGRGPAMLINRGFSVKFQLTPGPKLQKPQQKMLPKISTVVQANDSGQLATGEDQNLGSEDQTVTEDGQDLCTLNGQQKISSADEVDQQEIKDDEVDAATNRTSPPTQDAAKQDVNKEESRCSDVADNLHKTDSNNELNASVSDLFALSETSEMNSPQSQSKKDEKMFRIFAADLPGVQSPRQRTLTTFNKDSPSQPKASARPKKTGKEQMILDFGQKLIGTVPCSACGMTYLRGDSADEMIHNKFHQRLLNALKFSGWQKERVVQDFLDGSRVLMITPDDKFALKKLEAIKNIVDEDLGFVVDETLTSLWKAFLFVKEKKVVGFCLAQSISHGYRMLTDSLSQESLSDRRQPFCCDDKPESVRCGISRIWVVASERRKHIATKLLDVVRSQFLMGYPLSMQEIAFSDPTSDGIKFASKYTKTPCFLVFRK